jgi:hypothetical protein
MKDVMGNEAWLCPAGTRTVLGTDAIPGAELKS